MNTVEKLLAVGLVLSLLCSGFLFVEVMSFSSYKERNEALWSTQIDLDNRFQGLFETQQDINERFLELFELLT